jgi:cbb3-type cytochrome oxidase cytochrome c subunit
LFAYIIFVYTIRLDVMKNITLSADEELIEAARARARAEHTTLNEQFREWLASYARERSRIQGYDAVVAELKGRLRVGRKLTRDEMNER